MKLAEALINRADVQKRIEQLKERLVRSARVQEGDQPPENPEELLAELTRLLSQLTGLVQQINRTNMQTPFGDGRLLTDVLAERDALALERSVLSMLVQAATEVSYRYSHSEVKYLSTVNIADLQKRMDDLARRYRELDTRIQTLNWQVDLVE